MYLFRLRKNQRTSKGREKWEYVLCIRYTPTANSLDMYSKPQDTVDHTPAGTGNYFSHGSLSKIFLVEFKSESLKNKKVSKFQQL